MRTDHGDLDGRPPLLCLLLVVLLVVFAAHLAHGERRSGFGNPDTVIYSVAAQRWSHGAVPYRDIIDQKPPLLYLFYRGSLFAGGGTPRGLWQGMTVMMGIGAIGLLLGLWSAGAPVVGVGAATAFLAFGWLDPLGLDLATQNYIQSESLSVAWAALACGLCFQFEGSARIVYAALAGAAVAAAALSKQPGALFLPAVLLQVLTSRRPWRGLLGVALGVAVVSGGFLLYFLAHGALGDAVEWVWTRNLYYARFDRPAASLGFHRAAALTIWSDLYIRLLAARPLTYALAALALPIALVRTPRRTLVCLAWCVAGLLACGVGGFPYPHYLIFAQLGLALLCGLALDLLSWTLPERIAGVAAAALVVPLFHLPAVWSMAPGGAQAPSGAWVSMAQRIRACAKPSDRLLAFQHPLEVLFWADLPGAGKYIHYPNPDLRPDPAAYMREVKRTKPAFLFINSEPFTPEARGIQGLLRRYVDAHYEPWFTEGIGQVYRRRGVHCRESPTHERERRSL